MYIKIYFDNRPLFLCDSLSTEIKEFAGHDDTIFIDEFSTAAVNSMIHEMRQPKVHAGILIHSNLGALKKAFWKKFKLIQAAGGLVKRGSNEYLFIYRRGKWDLPKGKLDPGESLEQCAIRELKEETGLEEASIGQLLLVSYHTYDENGKHFLKETHWYSMTSLGQQELVPQLEEQITSVKWANPIAMKDLAKDTYPSILDVLEAAGCVID